VCHPPKPRREVREFFRRRRSSSSGKLPQTGPRPLRPSPFSLGLNRCPRSESGPPGGADVCARAVDRKGRMPEFNSGGGGGVVEYPNWFDDRGVGQDPGTTASPRPGAYGLTELQRPSNRAGISMRLCVLLMRWKGRWIIGAFGVHTGNRSWRCGCWGRPSFVVGHRRVVFGGRPQPRRPGGAGWVVGEQTGQSLGPPDPYPVCATKGGPDRGGQNSLGRASEVVFQRDLPARGGVRSGSCRGWLRGRVGSRRGTGRRLTPA